VLSVLCSGALIADPRRRTSANGNEYATAALRVACEDGEAIIASLICFDEHAVTALVALSKGDSCAIAGRARLSSWTGKDGNEAHGLSVTADRVLTAYAAGKMRKAARDDEEQPA